MKGSTRQKHTNSVDGRTHQTLQSSLHAQPFVPESGIFAASSAQATGSIANRNTKLSLANVNATPFVPGNPSQDSAATRSTLTNAVPSHEHSQTRPGPAGGGGQGYLGNSQGSAWALPEGDDLLGLTAHTPGQTPLQQPATPVQDGWLDRAAGDAVTTMSATFSPARGYSTRYQDQSGAAGRGRGRGRLPATSSPVRAAPSPDRAAPAYGRGPGRGTPQHRGYVGGADASPLPAYGLPTGQTHGQKQQMQMQYTKDQLRQELQQRSFLSHAQAERRPEEFGLPELVQQFHSLVPLENLQAASEQPSNAFGVCTMLLRAASPQLQGQAVTLRRLDPRQVMPSQALLSSAQEAVDMWQGLCHHPGLVCPRAALVSDEVGSRSALYVVHDHMPGAVTLEQAHMQPQASPAGLQRAPAAEQQLWSYATQLAMALRAAHTAGCAVGGAGLAPSKVLLTSRATARIKIGSIGVVHVLKGMRGRREDISLQQQEDIAAVGPLLMRAAGAAASSPGLQALSGHLTPHLMHLLASLQNGHIRDCHTLCAAVHEHALEILEGQMMQQDIVMSQLSQELDNGRLLRLLSRLVMVSEGSPTSLEPNWSETGDRYLIKLFKDFVFRQVNEAGGMLVDWAHVIEALNKLDLGVTEKIMLLSRDEMSVLLVSYADVKQCINSTFKELEGQARRHD